MSEYIEKNRNSGPYLKQLDGLRGLAILLVATGHIFYRFYLFKFGWIGLNLFFLLSGYLITQRLFFHKKIKTGNYFINFYARRILRIFPLYYGCLIIFFIALPLIYIKYQHYFGSLYNIQIWYWLYISNWRIILHGLPANPLFFHFWSLAVEEQFYIIWPFIFYFIGSYNKRIFIIFILIAFSILFRIWFYGTQAVYYNTLTAGEPLLLGCLICILEKNNRLGSAYKYFRMLAVISIISIIIIFSQNHDLHISNHPLLLVGYLNIDLLWGFILCNLVLPKKTAGFLLKVFSSRMLVQFGIYSYGIYVFHWIILQLFIYKYEIWVSQHGFSEIFSYWFTRILGTAIILLISYISYHFYESKFLSLKKYFG